METVFIVILEDRHIDTAVYAFSSETEAIEWARELAKNEERHTGSFDEELTDTMKEAGWKYHATYSCEGDSVRVVEKVIDDQL